jgi:hypothetical protein
VEGCDAVFRVLQEPDQFFDEIERIKVDGAVEYRRGNTVVQTFPGGVSFNVSYKSDPGKLFSQGRPPCKAFNARDLKFKATWKGKSGVLPAGGIVYTQRHESDPFCENLCADSWTYGLTVDSTNVPLTDNLILVIDTANEDHLAKFQGSLGTRQ